MLTMLKVQLKAWVCSRPALGLIRGEDHLKGFQDWVMTRCVVVLALLCVEMCLVQSWFGLLLHVGVNAVCCACLLVCWFQASFETVFIYLFTYFFAYIFFFAILRFSTQALRLTFCPPRYSLALTHTPAHTPTPHHPTSRLVNPSLCCVVIVSLVADSGSCFLAVTESQWASKERWQ